jgi:hypothetical protein
VVVVVVGAAGIVVVVVVVVGGLGIVVVVVVVVVDVVVVDVVGDVVVVGAVGMVVVGAAGGGVGAGVAVVVVEVELTLTVGMFVKSESVKVVGWRPPPVEPDGEDAGVVVLPPWSCCDWSTSSRRRAITVEDVELGVALVVVGDDDSVTAADGVFAMALDFTAFGVRTARLRGVDVAPESRASETPTATRMQARIREMSALRWRSDRPAMSPLSDSISVRSIPSGESGIAAASRSHWGHREPDIVWSQVRRASDEYGTPHSVLVGFGEISVTACHSGAQWLRRRSETNQPRRGIAGTARYLIA